MAHGALDFCACVRKRRRTRYRSAHTLRNTSAGESMRKLSLLDQIFYSWEASGMAPTTMGGAIILDARASRFPLNAESLANHVAARMEKIPLLRKRLMRDPLHIGQLRLVDDPAFQVQRHITQLRLAKPGGYREFTACLGTLSAQRLDVNQPLWHITIIDGLRGGRLAIAAQLHHAILDGVALLNVLHSLWDTEPVAAEHPATRKWRAEKTPSRLGLLRDAVLENTERFYVKAPQVMLQTGALLIAMLRKEALKAFTPRDIEHDSAVRVTIPRVHATSINLPRLTPGRVVSYLELPMADIKALSRYYECSINDLVILFNSCALERYFQAIGETIDFDLVLAMPISTRKRGDRSGGNAITAARLCLHNRVADLEQRLRAIVADTTLIKQSTKPGRSASTAAIDPRVALDAISPLLLDAFIHGLAKLHLPERLMLANVGSTNVPGPDRPQYIAGARQVGVVPLAPVIDTVGLISVVTSMDTHLAMVFHGCDAAIADKEALVDGVREGFHTLKRAAGLAKATRTRTRTR
jgi:diacylglycerol O-acyltransferase / wax synthase